MKPSLGANSRASSLAERTAAPLPDALSQPSPQTGFGASVRAHSAKLRTVSLLVLALSVIALTRVAPVQAVMNSVQRWLDGLGPLGVVAFVAIYVSAALLFVPGSVLTAAAGALFGLAWGTAIVSAASTLTAATAFLVARHFARAAVERKAASSPRFRAIDRAIGQGGWRVIALLRLSPVVPFSLGNYLFGLTPVRFWPYVIASWVTMLPGTFLYVYLGHVGRESLEAAGGASARGPGEWALLVAGLVATAVVLVYVTRLARRALRESTEIEAQPTSPETKPSSASALVALAFAGLALSSAALAVYGSLRRDELRRWAESLSSPVSENHGR